MVFSLSHLYCITFCGYCKQFFGFFTSNFVTYEQTVNFSGEITVFLSNLLTPPSVYAKIYFVGGRFGSAHFCLFSTNTNRLTTNAASRFFVYDYCVRQGKTSEKSDGVVTYSDLSKSTDNAVLHNFYFIQAKESGASSSITAFLRTETAFESPSYFDIRTSSCSMERVPL